MKKLIIILVVVCLLFAGVVGYLNRDALFGNKGESAESEVIDATATAAPVTVQSLDYAAMYALYDPETIVMTMDGEDISWGEYFSWLYLNANQVQNYFSSMANYGMALNWSDAISETNTETYAQNAVSGVESTLKQFLAIQGLAKKNGLELSETAKTAMEEQKKNDIVSTCGEGATEEDFLKALAEMYMTEDAYERMSKVNYEYRENFTNSYGENGEKITDEEALAFLNDNGYISAGHILLATMDMTTGEALDEAAVAEKKATAEKLYAELSAITDHEQLLQRFKELKDEYCEDAGKASYPDGYVFTPGTMDKAFETACAALEEYAVSEPVESSFGYHIILRLPQNPDRVVQYSEAGTALTARSICANSAYALMLEDYMAGIKTEYAKDFKAPNLLDYIIEQ